MRKPIALCLTLLFLLCACAPADAPELSPGPSASESAAPSETPEDSSAVETPAPTALAPADYGFSEIEHALRDFLGNEQYCVMAVHDADPYTAVQYTDRYLSEETIPADGQVWSVFNWFDRESGEFYPASWMAYVQDFHLSEAGELLVRTTGVDVNTDQQRFPVLYRSNFAAAAAGEEPAEEPYYMPLDQSLTIGAGKPETLLELRWEEDALHMVFGPQAGQRNILMYTNVTEMIPVMELTTEGGETILRLQDVILGEDLVLPEDGRILAVEEVDGDTLITLDCGEATRYWMGGGHKETEPQTITASWEDEYGSYTEELPLIEASLRLVDDSAAAGYPEGW